MAGWKKKPLVMYTGPAGHLQGPCTVCQHKECESMYEIADKTCEYCLRLIGLNVVWRFNPYSNTYHHYNCYMECYISVNYTPKVAGFRLERARKELKAKIAYAPPPSLPSKDTSNDEIRVNLETKSPFEITKRVNNRDVFLGICSDAEMACKWSRADQMYRTLERVAEFLRQRGTTKEEWVLRGEIDTLLYSAIIKNTEQGAKNDDEK